MSSKIIKGMLVNIGLAIAAVVLYSPGLIGLRLSDPSIFKAGMSILSGIFLAGGAVVNTRAMLMPPKEKPVFLNNPDAVNEQELIRILNEQTRKPVVTSIAQSALKQISECDAKSAMIIGVLDNRFQKGTITHTKFYATIMDSVNTLMKNTAFLANKMQAFDSVEYARMQSAIASQEYRKDSIDDSLQEEKFCVIRNNLDEMSKILNANERILISINKFSQELSSIELNASQTENDRIIEEIEELLKITKYYS